MFSPILLLYSLSALPFLCSHVFARDGLWERTTSLASDHEIWNIQFTRSIGVHKDTVVMGIRGAKENISYGTEVAHVFTLRGSEWVSDQILHASVQKFGSCGSIVAIYEDWILIGCPYEKMSETESGAAYLFHRQNSSYSFVLSVHGDFLSIGSPYRQGQLNFSGTICNYIYTSGDWESLGCLLPLSGGKNDYYGYFAAIHNTWMAVGAPGYEIFGVVYLYSFQSNWQQTQTITGNVHGVVGDSFGTYLSLHERFLAISAPYQKMPNSMTAAVYMYALQSTEWAMQSIIRPSDHQEIPPHGYVFSLSKNYLCISSYQDGGYIWPYSFNGDEWVGLPSFLGESPFIGIDGRFLLTKYFDPIDYEYKATVFQNPGEFTHSQLPTESYAPQTESSYKTVSSTHSHTAEASRTRMSIESSNAMEDNMRVVMLTLGVLSISCVIASLWCICRRCIDRKRKADAVEESFMRRVLAGNQLRGRNNENIEIASNNSNQRYGATGLIMVETRSSI